MSKPNSRVGLLSKIEMSGRGSVQEGLCISYLPLLALESAAAKGFADVSTLQGDACLRPLAAEARFQTLVRTMGGGAPR